MPTSGKDLGYDEISISNIPAKQNILKSNVKVVSGGSVIALDSFGFRKGAKGNLAGSFFFHAPYRKPFREAVRLYQLHPSQHQKRGGTVLYT